MRVRVTETTAHREWLPPGQELVVLSVRSAPANGSDFLLWSPIDRSSALFPARDLVVVDGSLSRLWRATVDLNGYVELSPPEWQGPDFWERFHDSDPAAVAAFDAVRALLEAE